ncbi:MAG TPA: hypothetical protein VFG62_23590 [Rhodopila sp.]|jgi:hypothetical protein|nr:hypothetical protein [Rhodopila sp.]
MLECETLPAAVQTAPHYGLSPLSDTELDMVAAGHGHGFQMSRGHGQAHDMGQGVGGRPVIVIDIVNINIGKLIATGGSTVTIIGVQNYSVTRGHHA